MQPTGVCVFISKLQEQLNMLVMIFTRVLEKSRYPTCFNVFFICPLLFADCQLLALSVYDGDFNTYFS